MNREDAKFLDEYSNQELLDELFSRFTSGVIAVISADEEEGSIVSTAFRGDVVHNLMLTTEIQRRIVSGLNVE